MNGKYFDPLDQHFKKVEFELKDDSELLNIFIGEMRKIQGRT